MNIDDLIRTDTPSVDDVARQRDRMHAAMDAPEASPIRARRRWKPVGALAACSIAAAILVAIAVQPSGDDGPVDRSERPRLQLVQSIPGGAFAKLDLDTASATEVLGVAGSTATNGLSSAAGEWEYTRIETRAVNTRTITERWMSADDDSSFMLQATIEDGSTTGRINAHYENLERGVIGEAFFSDGSATAERRAMWDERTPDVNMVLFTRLVGLLRDARSASDVGDALDELLPAATTKFDANGYMCQGTGCMGIGPSVTGLNRLAEGEGRTVFTRAFLIQSLATNVYSRTVTRAVYDYLAAQTGAEVSRASDDTDDLVLRYRTHGERPAVIEEATLDGGTGRIVAWGPPTAWQQRWVAWGRSTAPVAGGVLCADYPNACAELRDLSERLERDPDARFPKARVSGDAR